MKHAAKRILPMLAAGTLTLTVAATAAAAARVKTVTVDCDRGKSVNQALEDSADELIVQFHGTCHEDVVIRRDRTTLQGLAPLAEIVGSEMPEIPFGGAITVLGASRVKLADFAARDGRRGVSVLAGGSARLEQVVSRDHVREGLTVQEASQATVVECSFLDNGTDGVGVWSNSELELPFDSTLVASGNGRAGVLLSTGSGFQASSGARVEVDDNVFGVAMQIGAALQAVDLRANGNSFIGVFVAFGSSFASPVEVRDSGVFGVAVTDRGFFDGGGPVIDNGAFGVYAQHDATVTFSGAVSGHGSAGMLLDGTEAWIAGATVSDPVTLSFGTRVDFAGGNSFTGGVACDGTVLTRGDVSCSLPAMAGALPARAAKAEIELPARFALVP